MLFLARDTAAVSTNAPPLANGEVSFAQKSDPRSEFVVHCLGTAVAGVSLVVGGENMNCSACGSAKCACDKGGKCTCGKDCACAKSKAQDQKK